jgi:hypothetical protein
MSQLCGIWGRPYIDLDGELGQTLTIPHSISFDPRGNKRFVLTDRDRERRAPVESRACWFNDMDYHGVEADPFFRYSIRVDGVFDAKWLSGLRRRVGG